MKYNFKPDIKTLYQTPNPTRSIDIIKNEPMLYGATPYYAGLVGGELTREFLKIVMENSDIDKRDWDHVVIDSRVTMTMEGAYPSIPGWHCDDVPRSEKYAQPDLSLINDRVMHYLWIISSCEDHTCTEFVSEEFEAEIDEKAVWSSLDKEVESKKPETRFVKIGELVRFDQNSIHRASPTKSSGWRFFIRLSLTYRPPANEIRNQVQIYVPEDNRGW